MERIQSRHYNYSGERACEQFNIGCRGVFYPTGREYSKLCGRIIGYQVGSPGAFHMAFLAYGKFSLVNMDHLVHIWLLAAGVTEETNGLRDCPCTALGQPPPDYVGPNNNYCESGNPHPTGGFIYDHFYGEDQLWDGEKCEGQCCGNHPEKSPPWFSVELANHTTEDIEVCIIM